MKKIITILISCFIAINIYSQDKKSFTIAFYNVENLYDTINDPLTKDEDFLPESKKNWNGIRYQKKLDDLANVISSLNNKNLPTIVGFAEVENRLVLEDLIKTKALKNKNYSIVHEESPDSRGIDVGLIYCSDEFKYLMHKKIPIPLDTEYKVRDILYTKGVLNGTDTLHVFVNHWKSRSGGQEETESQRIQCAKTLRNSIDSLLLLNINANIIVIGDLNDTPRDKSIFEYLKANNDKSNYNNLFNLMLSLSDKGEGTHSYRGEWNILDNIIVSQALIHGLNNLEVLNSEGFIYDAESITFTNNKGEKSPNRTYGGNNYYGGYSDHYPIYFVLIKN